MPYEPKPNCYPIGKDPISCIPEDAISARLNGEWWEYCASDCNDPKNWRPAENIGTEHYFVPINAYQVPILSDSFKRFLFIGIFLIFFGFILRYSMYPTDEDVALMILQRFLDFDVGMWFLMIAMIFSAIFIARIWIVKFRQEKNH